GKIHRRFQEAWFDPNMVDMYDKLFSISSTERGLWNVEDADSYKQCVLKGPLWQTYAGKDPDWFGNIFDVGPGSTIQNNLEVGAGFPPVPPPQVQTFLSQHLPAPPPAQPSANNYRLDAVTGTTDSLKFFSTPLKFSDKGPGPTVTVKGTAV